MKTSELIYIIESLISYACELQGNYSCKRGHPLFDKEMKRLADDIDKADDLRNKLHDLECKGKEFVLFTDSLP